MPDPDIAVRVGLDHDPDDPALTYTDITDRVHYGDGGQAVTVTIGRQDESGEIKPTEISGALRNGDGRFTPNNSASPYAGKWEQGRRIQIAETVGGEEFLLGTCFLEIPDMPVVDQRSSQPVVISAVDRLGRADSAPPFDGTLAEHIRATSGALVEWFPLSDTAESGQYMSSLTGAVTQRVTSGFANAAIIANPEDLIRSGDIAGPPGDDQSYARWAPVGDADGLSAFAQASLLAPVALTAQATDTVALSAWLQIGAYDMAPGSNEPQGTLVNLNAGAGSYLRIQKSFVSNALYYAGGRFYPGAGSDQFINVGRAFEDVWRFVTVRINLTTGLHELWVGADAIASATYSTAIGAQTYTDLEIGDGWSGGIAHIQVRIGSGVMNRAEHLAQHLHGYRGLERQTVAERIVTLAGYAGIPASEVNIPAAASTPMQVAKLAGANPAATLRAAAATGQDLLITDGAGRITVVPRAQRYNQDVSMEIPYGWIRWRALRHRPDRPVTDVTVTRTGGGTVRRTDRARARRYGVTGKSFQLDTAVDADPANLASWALDAFGVPRTRCPSIVINMLRRTIAERKALLRLRVGDRIELTGLPAGSPDDLPHLIVQGIKHTIGPGRTRLIEFNTSPLLGPSVGEPPACPMVGDLVSTTAIVAY